MSRGVLQMCEHATGFHVDAQIVGVHSAHRFHALQRQEHLLSALIRNGAHHEASVAPLRHERDTKACTGFHYGTHLQGAGRTHHAQGAASGALAPVLFVGAQVCGRAQHLLRPHQGLELLHQSEQWFGVGRSLTLRALGWSRTHRG